MLTEAFVNIDSNYLILYCRTYTLVVMPDPMNRSIEQKQQCYWWLQCTQSSYKVSVCLRWVLTVFYRRKSENLEGCVGFSFTFDFLCKSVYRLVAVKIGPVFFTLFEPIFWLCKKICLHTFSHHSTIRKMYLYTAYHSVPNLRCYVNLKHTYLSRNKKYTVYLAIK